MPAYNEALYIEDTLNSLKEVVKKTDLRSHEIIVIDDGSFDKTPEKLQKITKRLSNILVFRNAINRGLGFSLRRGISEATGEKIIIVPADGDVSEDALCLMINKSDEADLVLLYLVNREERGVFETLSHQFSV